MSGVTGANHNAKRGRGIDPSEVENLEIGRWLAEDAGPANANH